MFDISECLDGLRCRETAWLVAERERVVREKRRLEIQELALTRVLDERGALGADLAARDGISERSARRMVETARALEALPEVAAAAYDGRLSAEQLVPAVALADETTDAEWAARAGDVAPADLARLARTKTVPTLAEVRRRRAARYLRKWWDRERGMLCGRFELADLDGAAVEGLLDQLAEGMRPAKGQAWDSRDHRYADALVRVCRACDTRADDSGPPTAAPLVRMAVQIPPDGPAEVGGIPLAHEQVEALRAQARIELAVTDTNGVPVVNGRARTVISDRTRRAVLLRDGHCRWPGCEHRTGLQLHHLLPVTWGGDDTLANLAAVCVTHHAELVPTGPWALAGNPNQPDGLTLGQHDQRGTARPNDARAGPVARVTLR